jgi:hypothetical protein
MIDPFGVYMRVVPVGIRSEEGRNSTQEKGSEEAHETEARYDATPVRTSNLDTETHGIGDSKPIMQLFTSCSCCSVSYVYFSLIWQVCMRRFLAAPLEVGDYLLKMLVDKANVRASMLRHTVLVLRCLDCWGQVKFSGYVLNYHFDAIVIAVI